MLLGLFVGDDILALGAVQVSAEDQRVLSRVSEALQMDLVVAAGRVDGVPLLAWVVERLPAPGAVGLFFARLNLRQLELDLGRIHWLWMLIRLVDRFWQRWQRGLLRRVQKRAWLVRSCK